MSRRPTPPRGRSSLLPLAFWRRKRGKTQSQLASDIGVSQNSCPISNAAKAKGDVTLYAEFARCLGVQIEDLVPEREAD